MAEEAASQREQGGINPDTHITVLAVLDYLIAGVMAFVGIVSWWGTRFAGEQGSFWSGMGFVGDVMNEIAIFVLVLFLALAIPALLAGIGLSQRKEWGRILTLVVSVVVGLIGFSLIVPLLHPVYAFWALTREEVTAQFKQGAQPAQPASAP